MKCEVSHREFCYIYFHCRTFNCRMHCSFYFQKLYTAVFYFKISLNFLLDLLQFFTIYENIQTAIRLRCVNHVDVICMFVAGPVCVF